MCAGPPIGTASRLVHYTVVILGFAVAVQTLGINLTALFAASGGYAPVAPRDEVLLAIPAGAHASLNKAAGILGLPPENLVEVAVDAASACSRAAR